MDALMQRQSFRFCPEKLKALRLAAGLTETELAAKSGMDANTLRKWEAGRTQAPNVILAVQVAKALGVQVQDFLEPIEG